MPFNVSRMTGVPEDKLKSLMQGFKEIDEADIVTAFRDDHGTYTVDAAVNVADEATGVPATSLTITGKMSFFGGPNDLGVAPSEGLALYAYADLPTAPPGLFLPEQPLDTTGLARRLNPDAMYLACRWDYVATPKDYLRSIKVKVVANNKSADASPVDYGPNEDTGRVADLSPGLASILGLRTDDTCTVVIPPPQIGVASDVDLGAIDKVTFPPNMDRSLVVMTTMNNSTYWVVDQIGSVGGGQTIMRKVANNASEVILSNTTVFPVVESDLLPALVANELNKAIPIEPPIPKAPSNGPPNLGDDINAKVFDAAKAFVGHDTSNVPGTEQGNLACAWAVNEVVRLALGKPIQADQDGNNGLGTDGIFDELKKYHTQTVSPSPGSIVISPTPPQGTVHGHVGIVGQNPGAGPGTTQIFSNSSAQKKFAQNRTIATWTDYYSGQLHLQVLFFNLNASQFTQADA